MKPKRYAVVGLCLLVVLALAACGTGDPSDPGPGAAAWDEAQWDEAEWE